MADHEKKTLELLQEIDDVRTELRDLYDTPGGRRSGLDQARINAHQASLRILLKLADVHAHLAVRQQLQEIASRLDGPVR